MPKEQFDITGMTCSACSFGVEGCVVKQRLFLSALVTIPLFYISMGHMMTTRSSLFLFIA